MELYDVGTSDLRDLWENPLLLESGLGSDSLMVCGGRDDDWSIVDVPSGLRSSSGGKQSSSNVVLRDRLMTDAALGGPKPIKAEHSYSLLACSPPPLAAARARSPVAASGARSHRQQQHHHHQQHHQHQQQQQQQRQVVCPADVAGIFAAPVGCSSDSSRLDVTDMEEECFPAISMNKASGRDSSRSSPEPFSSVAGCAGKRPAAEEGDVEEEEEEEEGAEEDEEDEEQMELQQQQQQQQQRTSECPMIKGEPLSAPGSPCAVADTSMFLDDKSTVAISPHSLHLTRFTGQTSDSEDDDEDMPQEFKVETVDLPCEDELMEQPRSQELPPTPPSSASSDSEGTVSASCSPERRDSHGSVHVHQSLRGFLQPRLYVTTSGSIGQHTTTRQPIHTPLISCQPKGSTGVLVLTEEEKRTLLAEGYTVPTKLPLTKQEEKSLKKVRRKIKNKISAQESRRKKKEYMDGLERRVTLLTSENSSYLEKLTTMENVNRQLQKELQRLQAIINQKSS